MKVLSFLPLCAMCAWSIQALTLQPGDILVSDDRDQISPPQGAILLIRPGEVSVAFQNNTSLSPLDPTCLNYPYGIVHKEGSTIIVCDYGAGDAMYGKVLEINLDTGDVIPIPNGGLLRNPVGLTLGKFGEIYVTDVLFHRIVKLHNGSSVVVSQGNYLVNPRSVAIEDDTHLLVADSGSNKIIRIDLSVAGDAGENQTPVDYETEWSSLRSVNVQGGHTWIADVSGVYKVTAGIAERLDFSSFIYPYTSELNNQGNLVVADPQGWPAGGIISIVDPNAEVILSSVNDPLFQSPLDVAIVPEPDPCTLDADNDGVNDCEDACPHSITTVTVIIDGKDTGVPNTVFANGCSISDQIAQCRAAATTRGEFVSCVSALTNGLKQSGVMTGKHKGAIESAAAKAAFP